MSERIPSAESNSGVYSWSMVVSFGDRVLLGVAMTAVVLVLAGCGSERGGSYGPDGAPVASVDIELSDFHVLEPPYASAPSGNVTFVVKNTGAVDHELLVLKTDAPFAKLPIVDGGDPPAPVKSGADKIDEGTKVGETGDPNLKPGQTRTFTIKNLAPGHYVLVCNIANHYAMGMRAPFTVN